MTSLVCMFDSFKDSCSLDIVRYLFNTSSYLELQSGAKKSYKVGQLFPITKQSKVAKNGKVRQKNYKVGQALQSRVKNLQSGVRITKWRKITK